MHCPFCDADRSVRVEMRQAVPNGPPMPTRVCDAGHVLPAAAAVITTKPEPKRAPAPAPASKPLNVLAAARARVRELDREIARLRKLTAERDELRRLLDAAKPRATVRMLKRDAS